MKRELYAPYFEGKKVTVMGIGILGRGVGDISFLAHSGAEVIATDKKTEEELHPSIDLLREYKDIVYRLGEHDILDFKDRDFILKGAGVPLDSECIAHARKESIPVYMSAALVTKISQEKLRDVKVIGVTGTRGKSTTTHLIEHILRENGKKVVVGGNVRGVANLPLLHELEDGDYLVMELDSWQLQGFGDLKISPHIAVFTSFLDDHLNYYHGDKELYFKDKAQIFLHQKEGDVCVASAQAKEEIAQRSDVHVVVPQVTHVASPLIGKHNDVALSLAIEVATLCGIEKEDAKKAVASFKTVPGRLENMGVYQGVTVFNDNNGTTPDATIAALHAVTETFYKKPILIVGGATKNLDLSKLEESLKEKTKEIVYLLGTGTDQISLPKKYEYEKLEDCISKAFLLAEEGDIILYSPGFASFSKYFKNEYEKNDTFVSSLEKYN